MSLLEHIQSLVDPPKGDTRVVTSSLSNDEGEHGLRWSSSQVTWSVGGVQRRKWAFTDPNSQAVTTACFAHFDINPPSSSSGSQKATGAKSAETFGPFALLQDSHLQEGISASKKKSGVVLTICIILGDTAHLYTVEGLEFIVNLGATIHSIWPLRPVGLLLRSQPSPDALSLFDSPCLYSLTRPYDELRPVLQTLLSPPASPFSPRAPSLNPEYHLFSTSSTILYVGHSSPHVLIPTLPLVIAVDTARKRLGLFRSSTRDYQITHESSAPSSVPLPVYQKREQIEQKRRKSQSRNELSVTLDRMALEGSSGITVETGGAATNFATAEEIEELLEEAEILLDELWSLPLSEQE